MNASRLTSLLCCATAFICGAASAQTPRVVKVAVTVEAQQFTDMLDEEQRKKIESTVASALATELARPFPIVDWRSNAGTDVPVATLTAAVVEHRAPGSNPNADPQINLVWRARSGNTPFDMPGVGFIKLYSSSISNRPVDDHDGQFTLALTNAALAWVSSETSRRLFKEQFLKHVLIANKVVAADSPFVVLPLPYQGVKMHKNSVLLVRYRDGGAGAVQQNEFTLTGIVPRLSDPAGNTQTHVGACDLGGQQQPAQESWAKCVVPLTSNPPKVVSVYAADYIYEAHPDAEGGVIVEE